MADNTAEPDPASFQTLSSCGRTGHTRKATAGAGKGREDFWLDFRSTHLIPAWMTKLMMERNFVHNLHKYSLKNTKITLIAPEAGHISGLPQQATQMKIALTFTAHT